jgi:hypothetical protein
MDRSAVGGVKRSIGTSRRIMRPPRKDRDEKKNNPDRDAEAGTDLFPCYEIVSN